MKILLTKQDLTLRYRVCERTIERWILRHYFPAPMYLHRRAPRWREEIVARWEKGLRRANVA